MKNLWLERAWVDGKFRDSVSVLVDERGAISEVHFDAAATENSEVISGITIPGIANVHSHAFQWKFAGQSEFRTRENDSFWTWREQMYSSLQGFDPEQAESNAESLYRLMLQHGYTTIGEFHYVHRQESGQSYSELGALADAHIRAALKVGMRICMIPVLYQRGGFDEAPLADAQCRFELSDKEFIELIKKLQERWGDQDLFGIGMAFHSLRAVDPSKMNSLVEQFDNLTGGNRPIHIHVAEQLKEVDDCIAVTGKRPVELLFENAEVDSRWCLIHATHMSSEEIKMVADSGAVVGLCPTTEANLGDGVFSSESYLASGGKVSIGSDSHVSVCPFSEMRVLEYGQRLTKHRRAVLCDDNNSVGDFLFQQTLQGGVQATGQGNASGIAEGAMADLVVLDTNHPTVSGVPCDHLMSRLVFGQFGNPVSRVMVSGRWVVGQ